MVLIVGFQLRNIEGVLLGNSAGQHLDIVMYVALEV